MNDPKALHLTVLERGGGTETVVARLCEIVPSFRHMSLEALGAWPGSASGFLRALHTVRAYRPDVVFCYGARAHVLACAAWPLGGPVLVGSIRGEIDFRGSRRLAEAIANRRVAFWVANSRAGLGDRRGIVIHNGVPSPPESEPPLLANLARPVIGLLANERPMKGHRFLLDAWRTAGSPGTLVFAGRVSADLRRDATRAGVLCTGHVPAGPLIRSLDLLALPSSSEGFPAVLPEAMSRGVPVLATPVGGVPELVRHGETGYLLPRSQWVEFLRSAERRHLAETGLLGQRHVLRHFTEERMAERFRRAARLAASRGRVSA